MHPDNDPRALKWAFNREQYPWPTEMLAMALWPIPKYLYADDPRPATEQFNDRFPGAWEPRPGFSLIDGQALKYPGDDLLYPFACTELHGDRIWVYPFGWVCVKHPDMTFEVSLVRE